jgi:pentatricopeptide repeat protein
MSDPGLLPTPDEVAAARNAWCRFAQERLRSDADIEAAERWFCDNGGLDSLVSSIRSSSRDPLSLWLTKHVRSAPVAIGSHPVRVLQGLYTAARLPASEICSESDSDPQPSLATMNGIDERRRQPAVSRVRLSGVAARDAVLKVLGVYKLELKDASTSSQAHQLTSKTRARLEDLQGDRTCRRHLAKSLSQMATALRKHGWVSIALDLLDWAIDNRAVDVYILNDAIQCHLAIGDIAAAESLLSIANRIQLASDGMYAALVELHAKTGDLQRAQELFDEANANHLAGEFCFTAMIDGYGKAGRIREAEAVFEVARCHGFAGAAIFTPMLDAYGKRGDLKRARELFDEAKLLCADRQSIYTALIDAYGKAGEWEAAERLFDELRAGGMPSSHSYAALLYAHGKAGNVQQAQKVFDDAKARGVLNPVAYVTMMKIYQASGRASQAQSLLRQARAARVW